MKRIFISFLIFFICSIFIYSKEKESYFFSLEYEIPSELNFIFSEETSMAIFIEEIKVDGVVLEPFDDVRDIEADNIKYELKTSQTGRIIMKWYKHLNYYIWNDGRGIIFTQNEEGFYMPKTNFYRFSEDAKELQIKYKVLLPYERINEHDLMISLPEDGIYTKIYQKNIKLK